MSENPVLDKPVSTNQTITVPLPNKPIEAPIQYGKAFHCFRCNTQLGWRVEDGLKVTGPSGTGVIMHPKQSFTCSKCRQRFQSVSLAFAGAGVPKTAEVKEQVVSVKPIEVPKESPKYDPKNHNQNKKK